MIVSFGVSSVYYLEVVIIAHQLFKLPLVGFSYRMSYMYALGIDPRNPVFEVSDQFILNKRAKLQKLARKWKFRKMLRIANLTLESKLYTYILFNDLQRNFLLNFRWRAFIFGITIAFDVYIYPARLTGHAIKIKLLYAQAELNIDQMTN